MSSAPPSDEASRAAPEAEPEDVSGGGLSGFFIRHPIATAMLAIAVFLVGLLSYTKLPVASLPNVSVATIQITAQLPGADATTNASSVATPLEHQLGQIPGLTQMTSSSALSFVQIALQFAPDVSVDTASNEVQEALTAAQANLPATLIGPPSYRVTNPADTPVLILAVTSDSLPLTTVDDYAESILFGRMSQIPGVGLVAIGGQQQPAMRIEVDPIALSARGLTMTDVRTAIQNSTLNAAKGSIRGARQTFVISTNDQIDTRADFENLVIAYSNGAPVRLRDIATARIGPSNTQEAGWFGQQPAIILNVFPQAGANIIDTVERIKAQLPALQASLPASVKIHIVSDRTTTIRASVSDVRSTLMLTVVLVVGAIFLFLRAPRATLIPGIAVVLSIVGTFAVMFACGFSLDNLSLMALSIAVGFVVDDAVVMVENVSRHVERGLSPMQAALKGAGEIGFTILAISISLLAVFIPLLLMSGLIGRMFQEFAITVAVAVMISVCVSLTLTPMLCSRFLTAERPDAKHGRVYNALERGFDWLTRAYGNKLDLVLRHQKIALGVMVGTIALTMLLFTVIPKGFFPEQDTGLIAGITQANADISPEGLAERQQKLVGVLLADPAVDTVGSYIGAGGSSPAPNQGRLFLALKPFGHRGPDGGAQQVIARLNKAVQGVTGIKLYLQASQDITIGARASKSQYQYTLVDPDPAELALWSGRVMDSLKRLPGITDVTSDAESAGPQIAVDIDRDAAARLGIAAQDIDNALYNAFGERPATKIFTTLNQYYVILEFAPQHRAEPDALNNVYLQAANGESVPLSQVATITNKTAPLVVNHQAGFPSTTISFNLAPGVSIGTAVSAVEQVQKKLHLPPTIQTSFAGNAAAFQQALSGQLTLIIIALVAVYLILGMLYESWIHPLTIISTLPSAGLGALLTLSLVGMPLDVIGLIGIVLLIGIVQKNGIMLVDFAIAAQKSGLTPEAAAREACLTRFRPILMTTFCAMLGGVPLMLGTGAGAEIRQPLGYAIVGGLALSQMLTLFTTPVVYLMMDRLGRRRGGTAAPAPTPVPA